MRRVLFVALAIAVATGCDGDSDGDGGASDPCALLTGAEVTEIMAAEPVEPDGTPGDEKGVCDWETDPLERETYFYMTLRVESLDAATEGYPDLRTAIDESTNVEIIDVDGLGNEAYATKTPLAEPDTVDGLTMALGDTVLDLGWQSQSPVVRDTARFEHVLDIAQKALSRL